MRRGFGALAIVYGALLLIGALAGRSDPLQPLAGLGTAVSPAGGDGGGAGHAGIAFKRIKSVADFDRAAGRSACARDGRSCSISMRTGAYPARRWRSTRSPTPAVQAALGPAVLLQADVTANDDADQALLQRFGILGPPTIVFFGADGAERPDYRVVGFKPAEDFAPHVKQAFGCPGSGMNGKALAAVVIAAGVAGAAGYYVYSRR